MSKLGLKGAQDLSSALVNKARVLPAVSSDSGTRAALEAIDSASKSASIRDPQSMLNVQSKVEAVCIFLFIALNDNQFQYREQAEKIVHNPSIEMKQRQKVAE